VVGSPLVVGSVSFYMAGSGELSHSRGLEHVEWHADCRGGYRRTSSGVANCGGVVTAALRAAFPTAEGLPLVVGSAAGSETWSNDDLSPQAHLLRFIGDASSSLPEQPRRGQMRCFWLRHLDWFFMVASSDLDHLSYRRALYGG